MTEIRCPKCDRLTGPATCGPCLPRTNEHAERVAAAATYRVPWVPRLPRGN